MWIKRDNDYKERICGPSAYYLYISTQRVKKEYTAIAKKSTNHI